uniref:1-phosphatidylinositol 4-kinase n=1 Tax=Physcomitrium patens TaxID=3218 RepID=A0A7I4EYQ7_PHYPA
MPPNAPGPVQVRKPVAVADTVNGHSVGRNGVHPNACRQVGGRRIFVQTYAGNVLGIELDRADKVESVKKKVQAAFNIPTEQSTLVFGDHVLDKDLSAISSDAPVLLRKGIYRSSSTPCLSPSSRDVRQSSVFEIVGGLKHSKKIQRLVREAAKGSEAGVQPVLASGGLGGAYYFRNCFGENVAIVKPTDEEPFAPNNPKGFTGRALGQPGLKPSIRVGETGLREVAAYLLDHDNFAKVPVTALVNATHSIFNVNAEYVGAGHSQPGNILVKKTNVETESLFGEEMDLIPIDHGLCLPETLDEPYFEWLHWPQASIPFSEEELDYIEKLDPIKDCNLLRKELPTLREACLRMLVLSTTFLKLAAEAGLTLSEIGGMMTRELCGVDEEASELEIVCVRAKMGIHVSSANLPFVVSIFWRVQSANGAFKLSHSGNFSHATFSSGVSTGLLSNFII